MPDRSDIFVHKIAALFHDPPWKPWGGGLGGYRLTKGGVSLECKCVEGYADWILASIANLKDNLRAILEGIGGSGCGSVCDLFLEALNESLNYESVNNVLTNVAGLIRRRKKWWSHEKQALIIPVLLKQVFKRLSRCDRVKELARSLGDEESEDRIREALEEAVEALDAALEELVSREKVVKESDVLAATVDRKTIRRWIVKKKDTQIFINPFNPRYAADVTRTLPVEVVAEYIIKLVSVVTLSFIRWVALASDDDPVKALYTLLFSLMEPVWYDVVGPHPPVADTRDPTHTVFDHLSAAAMTVNWVLESGRLKGYYVVVDLLSVQRWVRESRRLRDLWASSWLASWLVWRAVEGLVREYGPDIMISPPARLHPFHAARVLGAVCGHDPDEWGSDALCRALATYLGLPHRWPLDVIVPAKAVIALPPNTCPDSVREGIEESYRQAWREILGKVINGASGVPGLSNLMNIMREVGGDGLTQKVAGAWDKIKNRVEDIEPPLPIKVTVVDVCEVYRNYRNRVGSDEHLKKLIFQFIADEAEARQERPRLRPEGRRSGRKYLELARSLHSMGAFRPCLVCGYGTAIVDGEDIIDAIMNQAGKLSNEKVRVLRWFAHQVHRERLCPYCLAKRLLRDILRHDHGAVGLRIPRRVYARLGRVTTDYYTSRTRLAYRELREAVEDVLASGELREAARAVLEAGLVAPNKFLTPADRKDLLEAGAGNYREVVAAEAVVLEASHDPAFPRELREYCQGIGEACDKLAEMLENLARNPAVTRVRRAYAIVRADADDFSKVLRGYLGMTTEEYGWAVFGRVLAKDKAEKAVSDLREIVNEYAMTAKVEAPTIIVSPSYWFTVSRALAGEAYIERDLVDRVGGLLIYTGGDDLLAILPPHATPRPGRGGGRAYPVALIAADVMRRVFWGSQPSRAGEVMLEDYHAFRVLRKMGRPAEGFNGLPGKTGVVPAPRVYGRTVVIHIADVKDPMWAMMSDSAQIIDSKASITHTASLGPEWGKDSLIVSSVNGPAVPLPFTINGEPACAADTVAYLLRLIDEGALGKGFINHLISGYALELLEFMRAGWPEAVERVITYVLSRSGGGGEVLKELEGMLRCRLSSLKTKVADTSPKRVTAPVGGNPIYGGLSQHYPVREGSVEVSAPSTIAYAVRLIDLGR